MAINRDLSLEHIPAGSRIYIKDSNLQFAYCNDILAYDLGLKPDQIIGTSDDDHFSNEIADKNRAEEQYILDTGTKLNYIKTHHSGEQEFWVRISKEPYRESVEGDYGVLAVMEMIAPRTEICSEMDEPCPSSCIECSPYIYWELDLENDEFHISDGWREVFGTSPDWTPQDLRKLLLQDEKHKVLDSFLLAAENQHFFNLKHRLKISNHTFWVHNQGGFYPDYRNKGMKVNGLVRSESKCRKRKTFLNLYNNTFEHSELPMLFLDRFGNITIQNSAFLKLWNLKSPEALNKNIKNFINVNKNQYREIIKSLKNEGSWKGTLKGRKSDESLFNVYVLLSGTVDQSGRLSFIMATILDLSERIILEERNRKLSNHFENLLKTTQDAFWQIDEDGNFKAINQKSSEMLGYSREQMLSLNINDVDATGETTERMHKIISDGSAIFKTKLRTLSGERIDVQVSMVYLPEDRCFFAIIRDISDSEALIKDFQRTRMELEEKNTALKVVLSTHLDESDDKHHNLCKKVQKTIMPLLNQLAYDAKPSQMNLIEQIRENLYYIDQSEDDELADKLNSREFQIARHIAQGLSSKEIAGMRGFSVRTVESYRLSIRKKLGLSGPSINLRQELEKRLFS